MRYMAFTKYTPEGLATVRASGFAARAEAFRKAVEPGGGTLETIYVTIGEWDLVAIIEASSDTFFSAMQASRSTGAIERQAYLELRDPEEADRISGVVTMAPPS